MRLMRKDSQRTRSAPSPLVGEGWGGGSLFLYGTRAPTRTPTPSPSPQGAGQSHVEILDSNRACESAAGFQSCAHDPISIPMLRPFAENWPHAIALGDCRVEAAVDAPQILAVEIAHHRREERQIELGQSLVQDRRRFVGVGH